MALNFNIPMPNNAGSFAKGFGFDKNLMQEILGRNQLAQKAAHEKEQMAQLERHFQANFGLSKAAAGRAAQAAADAHKESLNKRDPLFAAHQYEALENYYKSKGQNQGQQGAPQPPMPTQEFGEGQGVMSPQGLQEAQQQAQQVQQPSGGAKVNGPDLELMKQYPPLRGLFKKLNGYDPFTSIPQTPEEKEASAIDLFNKKETIKKENKAASGEILTDKIKSKYQNVIGGAASAKPILRKLITQVKKGEIPGQMIAALLKRDAQASYKGEISTLLDGIRNAYTIPNTDSGTTKAEDKVLRKSGESDSNYAKRLETILGQIEDREKDANVKLSTGNITAGKTVHLVGPNGEDYDVPESEVDSVLQENPGVRRG